MFERYTEGAKRAIFFARQEATELGSGKIDTEHLLLGLLHYSHSRVNRVFGLKKHTNSFRLKIKQRYPPSSPLSITDLPLTEPCKWALVHTAEEAQRLGSQKIDTDHLVLGLLRDKDSFVATLLAEVGLDLARARQIVAPGAGQTPVSEKKPISPFIGSTLIVILLLAIYLVTKLALGQ